MTHRACIRVFGARQHNLKNIDVYAPRGALTVVTGLSGSGKSSLAFDTIYAEGQRRYVESLSPFARQFLEQMQKPDVDRIEGLSPTIAIEQRSVAAGPRSTVATATEIHDFLRVLFARAGQPRCWICDRPIVRQSTSQMVDAVLAGPAGQRILVLAPLVVEQRGQHKAILERMAKEGFVRARIDGEVVMLEEAVPLEPNRRHTIEAVVDRLTIKPEIVQRLADSIELATRLSGGRVIISAEVDSGTRSASQNPLTLPSPRQRSDEATKPRSHEGERHGGTEARRHEGGSDEATPDRSRGQAPPRSDEGTKRPEGDRERVALTPTLSQGERGLGTNATAEGGCPTSWCDQAYSAALACPVHAEVRIHELSPQLFSFNSPHGACEMCHGLGTALEFDRDLVVPDPGLSLADGAIAAWRHQGRSLNAVYSQMIHEFCNRFGVLPDIPFRNVPKPQAEILLNGTTEADAQQHGASFEGVLPNLKRRWQTTESESAKQRLHAFLSEAPCERCQGARLNQQALSVKIDGRSIVDVARMTIAQAAKFFESLTFTGEAAAVSAPLLREIRRRLEFLCEVGVDYLGLDRASSTLSGGEFQRIRLATQIGSALAGICYVLDEPTIGLHPRDTRRLTTILQRLAGMDNTVIVVEHEEEVIAGAAHMIDIGPGAGAHGGYLVAQGTLDEVLACPASITGKYLTGELSIALPEERRKVDWDRAVEVRGATANNLKNINVRFPLGCFVAVTGVSGSGKSTLVTQVLLRALKRRIGHGGPKPGPFERIVGSSLVDKVIEIDQSPIGRTPRSNPATYVGVFNLIRDLYARTREAKIRGYGAARFSFNIAGGRCELCEGQGVKRIAMHFLPDVFVPCGECGGTRYNRETLEVRYRGKTIADVLNMPVEEGTRFFENFTNISRRLQALKDVGLGYMTLGQASSTLSGGEAQRVKLAAELHRSPDTQTMYVLDEPTMGLHFADVRNLLTLLNRLVDRGHTVVVIEHNLDVIKVADWVIDLGPEGGDAGGRVVVEGTPEQVADCGQSYTGNFLKARIQKAT